MRVCGFDFHAVTLGKLLTQCASCHQDSLIVVKGGGAL